MNKRTALARWTSLLAVLTLVLAACTFPQIPSTTTATPIHVSIPALDANAIAKILHSKIPAIATVPFPKFIKTPLGPHIPSTNDISDFTFYWQGSPVPYPVNQLTLFSPNCSQPMNVDSFSVAVTTNKATTFQHGWIAMTFANNVQTNYAVGPGTTSTFNSASTHSFAQDIPFSLNCGTYQIGLWVNFGTTGGYLLESLVIEGTATTTPVATSSASLGDMSGFTFFWQGSPVPYPSNQLTLYSLDCSQPLTVDSFSIAVTTNKATSFQHGCIAMTFINNVQTTYALGPGTTSIYLSASTQTFAQDIPFSLKCGTYNIGLWVNFGTTGGYLLESLVIEGTATPTP